MNGDDFVEIVLGLFGLVGVMTGALFSYLGLRHSRQINDAVNHRHERGPEALKLYDLALENRSSANRLQHQAEELLVWKRSYEGGPLDTGAKADDFVEIVGAHMDETKERLDKLEQKDNSKN